MQNSRRASAKEVVTATKPRLLAPHLSRCCGEQTQEKTHLVDLSTCLERFPHREADTSLQTMVGCWALRAHKNWLVNRALNRAQNFASPSTHGAAAIARARATTSRSLVHRVGLHHSHGDAGSMFAMQDTWVAMKLAACAPWDTACAPLLLLRSAAASLQRARAHLQRHRSSHRPCQPG